MQYLEEKVGNEITNKSASELNKLRTEMDNRICVLSNKVDDVTKKLSGQVKTYIQSTEWSHIIKKQVDVSLVTVADNLQEVKQSLRETTEKVEEQRDEESRRNNVILYNVPESEEPRAEDRNKAVIAFCLH